MSKLQQALQNGKSRVEEYILANRCSELLVFLHEITKPFLMPSSEYDLYRDITPYDSSVSENYGTEYINASFVTMDDDRYIACQEPKGKFAHRFLSLVEKSEAKVIIALKDGCEYSSAVSATSVDIKHFEGVPFLIDETLRVGKRSVRRVTCVVWKDHSVLSDKQFRFLYEYLSQFGNETKIIHCKAGVGRTGTFIMYRALMKRLNKISADVFAELLIQLRLQRTLLVQSACQLEFLINKFLKYVKNSVSPRGLGDQNQSEHVL